MKKALFFLLFLILAVGVSAAVYKETCPSEAKAILDAVGGCSAVNCTEYFAICEDCCEAGAAANVTATPTSALPAAATQKQPGFEIILALSGILAVAYLAARRKH